MTRSMLTLFVDASYCPKTKAAGWGAWLIKDGWDRGRFLGGPMRRPFRSTLTVELCGIASAVHDLEVEGVLDSAKIIVVQCDNISALGAIVSNVPNASAASRRDVRDVEHIPTVRMSSCDSYAQEAIRYLRTVLVGKRIFARHIKGHQSDNTGRAWINDQCDAEAKRHMRAVREELREQRYFKVIAS